MIIRTEFSIGKAFGSVDACLARLPHGGIIADDGAWGHVAWANASKKANKPFGLGTRIRVSEHIESKTDWREVIIVPTSSTGLREMYGLIRKSNEQSYYFPKLLPKDIGAGDWLIIASAIRNGHPPDLPAGALVPFVPGHLKGSALAFSDNFYPAPKDRKAWSFAMGEKAWTSAAPAHIQTMQELRAEGASTEALASTISLLKSLDVSPPKAENIKFPVEDAQRELAELCRAELSRRGLDNEEYKARLEHELTLTAEKGFADYFLVIADMIAWAKKRMLVGPGRGSSAGSIICWLLRITEVDPIYHGLLFERFIDSNRFDLPDIDIDFPDSDRYDVLSYLAQKYGQENVAHLGTILRYKPKSALGDVAKQLKIPPWELDAVKDVIVERSSGDSRVNNCLEDTIVAVPAGQKLLKDHPEISIAFELEGAAKTTGTHAAGMIVCNLPVDNFCAIGKDRVAQIDKKAATDLNMLKIDALGLRTLSVLDTCCNLVDKDREFLYGLPLDDQKTFEVFNKRRFTGIFQFEGYSLQSVAAQITFRSFEDISGLTALARPGPLGGGEAMRWIARHEGREPVVAPHPMLEEITRETFGIILYQEQVMVTTRKLGNFSWKDTSAIRKLMSNRSGDESFRKFESMFLAGATENGIDRKDAEKIWKGINSFGSWAFNKSHAVVYGLISYWCAYMKAHWPLEFACACLRHNRGDDSVLVMLRELTRDGIEYVAIDPELSEEDWTVKDGKLIGGLLGIPGIGAKKAKEIMMRRNNGLELTEGHKKLLSRESVYEHAFPTRKKFGDIYANPYKYDIRQAPLKEIVDVGVEHVVIIGKLLKKNLRDMNEDRFLAKRNGVRFTELTSMLIFHIGDDTGRLIGMIDRFKFEKWGKKISDEGIVDKTWLMVRGHVNAGRFLNVEAVRWLGE